MWLVGSLDKAMANEIIIGVIIAAVTTGGGVLGIKLRRHWTLPDKVDRIEADLTYVRSRLDNVYDALINR
jgi:hypothetical protein